MHDHHPTVITTRDYDRLQALMCTMTGARTPLATLLRHKLCSAVVMLPTDLPPDVVAAGRLVRFTVDGNQADERIASWEPLMPDDDRSITLTQARGLALLGVNVGQSFAYATDAGQTERIEIDYVFPDDAPLWPDVAMRSPARTPRAAARLAAPASLELAG